MGTYLTRNAALAGCIASIGLLLGGCPPLTPSQDAGKTELRKFSSAKEFLDFFKNQAWTRQRAQSRQGWGWLFGAAGAPRDSAAGGEEAAGGNAGENSYSTTNLQEEGVDESDVVKSDGEFFYIARGQTVRVVRATPVEQMEEVGRVDVGVDVDSLYLRGSTVLALGQKYDVGTWGPGGPEIMIWPPFYMDASVAIVQVDVSEPDDPQVVGSIELDGSLVSSRLTNDQLIVVLTIAPKLPENPSWMNISAMGIEQVLPKLRRGGAAQNMLSWEDYYAPESGDGYYTTAVVVLDADDVENMLGRVGIMANAGTVYSSTEALYTTDSDYDAQNNYRESTRIHKFKYTAQGTPEYVGSGKVPGRLLNQFSLGEHEGYLRVATHVDNGLFFGFGGVGFDTAVAARAQDRDPNQPYNAVYVLREADGKLDVVGALEDIAPGEQLYAARFLGTRGYLVTFLQIDPLFVLDLSDPNQPTELGQLKVDGYSDYLHPWGDHLLIGVGRSTTESPWGGVVPDAVQLSLFDVSNPAEPVAIEQIVLGGYGSSCDVSYTHKAFTFLPSRGLLAIPVQLMKDQGSSGGGWGYGYDIAFDGVVCFQVDEQDGFTELGRVAGVIRDPWGWTAWRRAAFIKDFVYAITADGVRAADIDNFDEPCELILEPGADENESQSGGGSESSPKPMS